MATKAPRPRARKRDEKPDPIRARLGAAAAPDAVVAKRTGGSAATGAPPAGQTGFGAFVRDPRQMLHVLGPGLITGASDDDPSGIGTYSQAGSQFGLGVLWLAPLTFPLMLAVQEACARIALHTGAGLGTVLRRRFPTALVGGCILALFLANTINAGADIGAVAAGGALLSGGRVQPLWLVAPVTLVVVAMQFRLPYAAIFRTFKFLTLALFAYIVTAVIVHPPLMTMLRATVVPELHFSREFIGIVVAILGTTISPYLFFWQASSEVEEMKAAGARTERQRRGVTENELRAARTDVVVGMFFSQLVMYSILLTSGAVLHGSGHTDVQSAQQAAEALRPLAGPFAFLLFAVGIMGTGLLAIPVLTGSAGYAVKEFLGIQGSLADRPTYRPTFYAIIGLAMVGGLLMNFLGIDPIKALVVTAVINGLVAPPILLLIAVVARDRRIMGKRRSGRLSGTLVWAAAVLMTAAAVALIATLF
jgi:NRAMP (natural resistance-associated macrophage protein)-like metal ion transporter